MVPSLLLVLSLAIEHHCCLKPDDLAGGVNQDQTKASTKAAHHQFGGLGHNSTPSPSGFDPSDWLGFAEASTAESFDGTDRLNQLRATQLSI